MTERRDYLLFDGACPKCSQLANSVEAASGGRLLTRSLHDKKFTDALDRARPGWRWEPTLLNIGDDGVQAFTGIRMRVRLARLVGARRAVRIARLARSAGFPLLAARVPADDKALGRRSVIKYSVASAMGLAVVVLGGSRQPAHADPCGDCVNACRDAYASSQDYCASRYTACRNRCGDNDECRYNCWNEYQACDADAAETYDLCNQYCTHGPCS